MDYKKIIEENGLLKSYVAKQIGVQKSNFSTFLNHGKGISYRLELKLKDYLTKYINKN